MDDQNTNPMPTPAEPTAPVEMPGAETPAPVGGEQPTEMPGTEQPMPSAPAEGGDTTPEAPAEMPGAETPAPAETPADSTTGTV